MSENLRESIDALTKELEDEITANALAFANANEGLCAEIGRDKFLNWYIDKQMSMLANFKKLEQNNGQHPQNP